MRRSTAIWSGGFAVIKDVPKTMVYELADLRNFGRAVSRDPEAYSGTALPRQNCAPIKRMKTVCRRTPCWIPF